MKHNYMKKFEKLVEEGKLVVPKGGLHLLNVEHDEWCKCYKGGRCNCDPNISFRTNVTEDEFKASFVSQVETPN
jgi:hypothetical protein